MTTMDIIQGVVWALLIAGIVIWLMLNLFRHDVGQLKKYRRVFELSPELIVLLNPNNGRVMEINGRVQDLTGYPPEKLVGHAIMEWPNLPEESKQLLLQNLRKRKGGELLPPCEMEFRTQSGQRLVGRVSVVTLTNNRGKILADMVSVSDITDRKLAEERLQKMLCDMERYNRLMVGREIRVVELKKEVNALLQQAGRPAAYPIGDTTPSHSAESHTEKPA